MHHSEDSFALNSIAIDAANATIRAEKAARANSWAIWLTKRSAMLAYWQNLLDSVPIPDVSHLDSLKIHVESLKPHLENIRRLLDETNKEVRRARRQMR